MSTRAAAIRTLACAASLAAFACGDARCGGAGAHDAAAPSEANAPAEEGASADQAAPLDFPITHSSSSPEAAAASAPSRELTDAEQRVAEVLDTDPEGAGLDALMRIAREDPDASVREAAVIALGDSEDDRAIEALIAATEDRDARVVLAAIDQLSWSDDRQGRDALERLTRSQDAEIVAAAEEALAD